MQRAMELLQSHNLQHHAVECALGKSSSRGPWSCLSDAVADPATRPSAVADAMKGHVAEKLAPAFQLEMQQFQVHLLCSR
jgi:hypothetical protein